MMPPWFDLRSATTMVCVSGLFMVLALASLARVARTVPGYQAWLWMGLLTPIGLTLNNLQGQLPNWVAFPVALTFMNVGVWLAWVGARRFAGLRGGMPGTVVVGSLTLAATWYFGIVAPNVTARVLAVSPLQAWATGSTAWLFWRQSDADLRFALRFAALPLALFSLVSVGRAVASVVAPPASGFAPTLPNTLAYLIGSAAMMCTYAGLVMCIHAVTTREVRREADHDTLTGLLNRHGLKRRYDAWRAAHADGVLALIDVDHLKRVNDTLGHLEGDELLTSLARTIERAAEPPALATRLGGDEFAVLLVSVADGRRFASECARGFSRACHDRYGTSLAAPMPALSIGVTRAGAELSPTLGAADAALYRAKTDGRARVIEAF